MGNFWCMGSLLVPGPDSARGATIVRLMVSNPTDRPTQFSINRGVPRLRIYSDYITLIPALCSINPTSFILILANMVLEKLQNLELPASADMHVHLRDGATKNLVVPSIRDGGVNCVMVMVATPSPLSKISSLTVH